jgi:thioredoxin reductase (NADPH)
LSKKYDLIIVGSGMAGLFCAKAALAKGLKVAILEAQMFGGLIININHLDPGLDDNESTGGADLAATWVSDLSDLGLDLIYEGAVSLELTDGIELLTATETLRTRALVVASGARLKRLGLPREEDLTGKGVSQCADCDGPMFHQQEVVVVGGGDSAAQEALVLAQFCSRVHWIHRGAEVRARAALVQAAQANKKIEMYLQTEVVSLLGDDIITGVELKNSSLQAQTLKCQGFFAFVGLTPNVDWLCGQLTLSQSGGLLVSENLATSYPGIYAIGAVRDGFGGLLKNAMEDAQRVVNEVAEQLAENA